jgi:hypothetical protein
MVDREQKLEREWNEHERKLETDLEQKIHKLEQEIKNIEDQITAGEKNYAHHTEDRLKQNIRTQINTLETEIDRIKQQKRYEHQATKSHIKMNRCKQECATTECERECERQNVERLEHWQKCDKNFYYMSPSCWW